MKQTLYGAQTSNLKVNKWLITKPFISLELIKMSSKESNYYIAFLFTLFL